MRSYSRVSVLVAHRNKIKTFTDELCPLNEKTHDTLACRETLSERKTRTTLATLRLFFRKNT